MTQLDSFFYVCPALANGARGSDPDYDGALLESPPITPGDGFVIQDLQASPNADSTAELSNAFQQSPIWRGFVAAKSLGAGCAVGFYATNTHTSVVRAIAASQSVTRTTGYELLDFGEFQLDEFETLAARIYGPSGGRIVYVSLIIRPDDYVPADRIDVSAPAWVTTSGDELVNSGEPNIQWTDPSLTLQPFFTVPGPVHDELAVPVAFSHNWGDLSEFPDFFFIPYLYQANLNGSSICRSNFGYGTTDDQFYWPNVLCDPVPSVPGDEFEVIAGGGWEERPAHPLTYHHSVLGLTEIMLAKSVEYPDVSCGDDPASRVIYYEHPRPGAIERYEARVYDHDIGPNTFLLVNSYTVSAVGMFAFPEQAPLATGHEYRLTVRTFYYDGSWTQGGECVYVPGESYVLRTRHQAGEAGPDVGPPDLGAAGAPVFSPLPAWKGT